MDKILNLFTAKRSVRPELEKVHIENGFAYATDSFKLLKMEVSDQQQEELRAFETLGHVRITNSEDVFPEVNRVIPSDKDLDGKLYNSVFVSPEFLFQVAEAMKRLSPKNKGNGVTIYVPCNGTKPVVFKTKNATALLMPMTKY